MRLYLIYGLGFLAQLLFGFRMIVQWAQSERLRKVVAPSLFWKASLVASLLFILYGLFRHDPVIVLGQTLAYIIYVRNLQLDGSWASFRKWSRHVFSILPILLLVLFAATYSRHVGLLADAKYSAFLVVGGTGQLLMNLRFVYQWWVSEKSGRSLLPGGFWMISIVGCCLVLVYAIQRKDPVLLVSQVFGGFVYFRNLVLYSRANRAHQ